MAKRKQSHFSSRQAAPDKSLADKPATLKDLLSADVVNKLKAQAENMKAEEARLLEEKRKREEETRKAEQKRLDNNFEHLLEKSSMDWHNYK